MAASPWGRAAVIASVTVRVVSSRCGCYPAGFAGRCIRMPHRCAGEFVPHGLNLPAASWIRGAGDLLISSWAAETKGLPRELGPVDLCIMTEPTLPVCSFHMVHSLS